MITVLAAVVVCGGVGAATTTLTAHAALAAPQLCPEPDCGGGGGDPGDPGDPGTPPPTTQPPSNPGGGGSTSPDTLNTGQTLPANQPLNALNSLYAVQVQGDGNLVVTGLGCHYWDSRTDGTGGSNYLIPQSDGNLVLYSGSGRAVWSSKTVGSGNANRLVMQNDANLVLYTSDGRAVWSALKSANPGAMCGNGYLNRGQQLYSFTRGSYYLQLGSDGNLVEYTAGGQPVWASNTAGSGAGFLTVTAYGNLQLMAGNTVVWSVVTNTAGAVLNLNDNGKLYLSVPSSGRQIVIHG